MLAAILGLLLTAEPDPTLLDRLEAHTERLGELEKQPGDFETSTVAHELDSDDKVTHTKVIETTVHVASGTRKTHLKRFTDDGKDVTEAKRDELENKPRKASGNRDTMAEISPFSKVSHGKYQFTQLGEVDGLVRIAFTPKGEKVPELMTGEALVGARSISAMPGGREK